MYKNGMWEAWSSSFIEADTLGLSTVTLTIMYEGAGNVVATGSSLGLKIDWVTAGIVDSHPLSRNAIFDKEDFYHIR